MKKNTAQKGFTMVEMIVVLGIFAVISGTVLFNYGKFRSDTILTNMAYEVALSIREAQIYGVSVRNPDGASASFSEAYGVYIPNVFGGSNQYVLFADNPDGIQPLKYDGTTCDSAGADTCVTPYTISGNIKITALHVRTGNACPTGPATNGLSLLFRRPNPEPIINNDPSFSAAQITLTAPDNTTKRYVVVYNNGQVAVVNQSICN